MNDIDLQKIKKLCGDGKLRWTNHSLTRLLQRGIVLADVIDAVQSGEIIESYPNDYPYPSYLILGVTLQTRYLHVVSGLAVQDVWIITAYYPTRDKWEADLKTRKGCSS